MPKWNGNSKARVNCQPEQVNQAGRLARHPPILQGSLPHPACRTKITVLLDHRFSIRKQFPEFDSMLNKFTRIRRATIQLAG